MTIREHVRLLGILQMVWAGIGLAIAAVVLLLLGGIGMIAASEAAMSDPNAAAAPAIVGLVIGGIAMLLLVIAIPGFLAGWGLLKGKSWARVLTIVLSALNLLSVPVGTALGIYGLWVLTQPEAERQFAVPSAGLIQGTS